MVKYINRPTTSFNVVIKGPVAKAGSILYLLSNKGISVPKMAATKMTANNEILTTKPNVELPKAKAMAKINIDKKAPLINATMLSLAIFFKIEPKGFVSLASDCTTIAEDCTPILPPIAIIKGM